ncbi:MAG: MbcA/ParS/Xre antitoxin family protein [Sedimenticola sp.]
MSILVESPSAYDPRRVSSAALQGFFNLSGRWGLTATQERTLIGSPPASTFFKWKAEGTAPRLGRDVLDRISYLLGIYKALNILLPSARAADAWVKKPNSAPLFHGQSALDRMLGGSLVDLADVRRYLDAQRGL